MRFTTALARRPCLLAALFVAVVSIVLVPGALRSDDDVAVVRADSKSGKKAADDAFRAVLDSAKEHEKAERLGPAEYQYRKLYFATRSSKFRKKYRKIQKKRIEAALEKEAAMGEDDRFARYVLLSQLYRSAHDSEEVTNRLETLGYRWSAEERGWVDEAADDYDEVDDSELDHRRAVRIGEGDDSDDSEKAELTEEEIEQERRHRILVTPEFELLQRGPLHIYTDVDLRHGRSTLTQMKNANLSGYQKFAEVMEPLVVRMPEEVVLVFFQKQEDYFRKARATPGSAGIYFPARRAGYFYEANFSTMLHEMAHQYTDLMLGLRADPWFQEGVAEYFGAASMQAQGKRMKVGVVDSGRLSGFKELAHEGRAVPLRDFQQMSTNLDADLYAQAWATFHYLMEIAPYGRLVLFDYIAQGNGVAHALGVVSDKYETLTLETALKKSGLSLVEFERDMFTHFNVRKKQN